MPTINFNGKIYNDLAEMPANERQIYEQVMSALKDEDGNGLPDILEGDVIGNIIQITRQAGGEYSEQAAALEKMSPEMRARISKGIARLNELGMLSGVRELAQEASQSLDVRASTLDHAEIRPSQPVIQSPSAIEEDTGSRRFLLVGLLAVILLAGIVFLILSRGGF